MRGPRDELDLDHAWRTVTNLDARLQRRSARVAVEHEFRGVRDEAVTHRDVDVTLTLTLIEAIIEFDPDDVDAAIAELNRRGGPASDPHSL